MLINNCNYSFQDLFRKAQFQIDIKLFYNMSQNDKNILVKKLCKQINWGYEDRLGTDGIIYTAFSAEFNND